MATKKKKKGLPFPGARPPFQKGKKAKPRKKK